MNKKSGFYELFPEEDIGPEFVSEDESREVPPDFLTFRCFECQTEFSFEPFDDPTSSHGACKVCGSKKWNISSPAGVVG
jgi:hypothetical protein